MNDKALAEEAFLTMIDLWQRTVRGERGVAAAALEAQNRAYATRAEKKALAEFSFQAARQAAQDNPWLGYLAIRIVLGAIEGTVTDLNNPEDVELRGQVIQDFLVVCSLVLHKMGHVGVYQTAKRTVEHALELPLGNTRRARLEYYSGVLHLDPYFANRDPGWHTRDIRVWQQAAKDFDPIEGAGPDMGNDDGLPTPERAREIAELHLRRAVAIGQAETLRDAYKALVQCLEAGRIFDTPVPDQDLVAVCDAALSILAEYPDPTREQYVRAVRSAALERLGQGTR